MPRQSIQCVPQNTASVPTGDRNRRPNENFKSVVGLLHLNVQGIANRNKLMLFEVFLSTIQYRVDCLCLSETWLTDEVVSLCKIGGYKLVNCFCRTAQIRGSVAIFGKSDLKMQPLTVAVQPVESLCEFSCCKLYTHHSHIKIVCIYRSPGGTEGDFNVFLDTLDQILQHIWSSNIRVILCGDFNVDFSVVTKRSSSLLEMLSSYNLQPHVSGVTRPASGTRLDNVFSNFSDTTQTFCEVLKTDISDHSAQSFRFYQGVRTSVITKLGRDYSSGNMTRFIDSIKDETWADVYQSNSADDKYNALVNTFYFHFDTCFTIRRRVCGGNSRSLPVAPEIKQWSVSIRELYSTFQRTGCPQALTEHKRQKKMLKKYLREWQKSANDTKVLSSISKSKAIWQIHKKLCGREPRRENMEIQHKGRVLTDPVQIADAFAENMSSEKNRGSQANTVMTLHITEHTMFMFPADEEEVYSAILHTQKSKTPSVDGIPPCIVHRVAKYVSQPLLAVVNECLSSGSFPNRAKVAKVLPIHKRGRKDLLENYRTISILPAFSKVIEKIIYTRLYAFFKRHDILSMSHFGFLPNISTEEALFNSVNYIISEVDKHRKVAGIYFDLSRAFATVDHTILLKKLEASGVRGTTHRLLCSYLSERKQSVSIESIVDSKKVTRSSECIDVIRGVPEGSILGPLLFLIYVNDVRHHLDCISICQYADDTSCIVAADSVSDLSMKLSQLIAGMVRWCADNKLGLNVGKTGIVHYTAREPEYSLYVRKDGKSVQTKTAAKFLGVTLDSGLTWTSHIDVVVKKLNTACYTVRHVRHVVNLETLRAIYFAFVHSVISYGIMFWGASPDAERVFVVQKRILRSMLGLEYDASCKGYFIEQKIITVPSLYIYKLAVYCRKNEAQFVKNRQGYRSMTMTTRYRDYLRVPHYHLTRSQKGPYYRAVKVYNALPNVVKQVTSMTSFKSSLKEFLIGSCFYSYEEFLGAASDPTS